MCSTQVGDDESDEQMFQSLDRFKNESIELNRQRNLVAEDISPYESGIESIKTMEEDTIIDDGDGEEDNENIFCKLQYESIHLKEDAAIYTVRVGSTESFTLCIVHT